VPATGWCKIQARMRITQGAVILGGAFGRGFGRIVCRYDNGVNEVLPILIETSAIGIGLQWPEDMDAKMISSGFGITNAGANGLLGTYAIARLGAGVGYANGQIGVNATLNGTGLSIPMTFQFDQGFQLVAAALNFGEMTLLYDPANTQARFFPMAPVMAPRPVPAPRASAYPVARPANRPAYPAVDEVRARPRRVIPADPSDMELPAAARPRYPEVEQLPPAPSERPEVGGPISGPIIDGD